MSSTVLSSSGYLPSSVRHLVVAMQNESGTEKGQGVKV